MITGTSGIDAPGHQPDAALGQGDTGRGEDSIRAWNRATPSVATSSRGRRQHSRLSESTISRSCGPPAAREPAEPVGDQRR